jgi:putative endopeptidase
MDKRLLTIQATFAAYGILAVLTAAASAQTKPATVTEKNPPLPAGLDNRFLDTSIDPCVDFAKYSCGKFPKNYPIPPDMSGYGTFVLIFEHTEYALHSLLEKVEAKIHRAHPTSRRSAITTPPV